MANNHTKNYEVVFAMGSVVIDNEVQLQISSVYNELPELNYADIQVKGADEDQFPTEIKYKLGKQRAKNVLSFLLEVGISERNVSLLYNKGASVLLFKPKGKLLLSEVIHPAVIEEKKQQYKFDCRETTTFTSLKNIQYQVENSAFCEGALPSDSRSNEVVLELTEATNSSEIFQMGVQGTSDLKVGSVLVVGHLTAENMEVKKGRKLKPFHKITLAIPCDSVTSGYVVQQGRIEKNQISWVKFKGNAPYVMRTSNSKAETDQFTLNAEINDTGFFRICALPTKGKTYRNLKISANGNDELQLYAYSPQLDVLVPAYQHTGYFNRYEFDALAEDQLWVIIAISKNGDSSYFFEQEIDISHLDSSSILNLDMKKCELGTKGDCIAW